MREHHSASVYYMCYAIFCLVAAAIGAGIIGYKDGYFHKIDALEGQIAGWERDYAERPAIGITKDELDKELGRQ